MTVSSLKRLSFHSILRNNLYDKRNIHYARYNPGNYIIHRIIDNDKDRMYFLLLLKFKYDYEIPVACDKCVIKYVCDNPDYLTKFMVTNIISENYNRHCECLSGHDRCTLKKCIKTLLDKIPDIYLNDEDIINAIVKDSRMVRYLSNKLNDNEKFCTIAITRGTMDFNRASLRLRSDKDFRSYILELCKNDDSKEVLESKPFPLLFYSDKLNKQIDLNYIDPSPIHIFNKMKIVYFRDVVKKSRQRRVI